MHDISKQVERVACELFERQEPALLRESETGRELYLSDPMPTKQLACDAVAEFLANSDSQVVLTFGPRKTPPL